MVTILKKMDSILLVIKEMQNKATMRFYYISIRWVKIFFRVCTEHWLGYSARNSLTMMMRV